MNQTKKICGCPDRETPNYSVVRGSAGSAEKIQNNHKQKPKLEKSNACAVMYNHFPNSLSFTSVVTADSTVT